MAGIVQLRNDTPGRAYYRRKLQQSKTSMEAMPACADGYPMLPAASSPPTPACGH
jgi:hypothetical protein